MTILEDRDHDPRLPENIWGPCTVFRHEIGAEEPWVIHQDGMGFGEGIRASIFRDVWRDEQMRKYTRGHCHEFAAASVEEHGGKLLSLMNSGRVVHVLAMHDFPEGRLLRDVTGDMFIEGWSTLTPEDFEEYSDIWLHGCPIDDVIVADCHPWSLPCTPPNPIEVGIARRLSAVVTKPEVPDIFLGCDLPSP